MMRPPAREVQTSHTPESLSALFADRPGTLLLRSNYFASPHSRYSFVTAGPFATFRSRGSLCEIVQNGKTHSLFGNPWRILDGLMSRYELLEELDLPFPLGGCFGFWGYDLKNFVEPHLSTKAINDLEIPDCVVGFYDSLVVFDHKLEKTWVVSSGIDADGSRSGKRQQSQFDFWESRLKREPGNPAAGQADLLRSEVQSNLTKNQFIAGVSRAQKYIQSGDIYQVNLSQRFHAAIPDDGWNFYRKLGTISPAPFSSYFNCGDFQIVSSSPEQFLQLSGNHIQTRPIKGTRPRGGDADQDARLAYELQTSAKENAELVMITDLLRNDLGRVCEFGSVQVPELVVLEKFPQVQHLVSRVEGRLKKDVTHFSAFASCFPGGSITGAPKIRAMEIIDELEPVNRGPYTGSLGYLGFNRESQLNILIRTAVCKEGNVWFHAGSGIVADSDPEFEYEETLAKAEGFFSAVRHDQSNVIRELNLGVRQKRCLAPRSDLQ